MQGKSKQNLNSSSFWSFRHFSFKICSAAAFVPIVVRVLPELEHLQDGMLITLFVIRAINSVTKGSHVPSAIELIEPPLIERWLNAAYAISE